LVYSILSVIYYFSNKRFKKRVPHRPAVLLRCNQQTSPAEQRQRPAVCQVLTCCSPEESKLQK
jgi:hypothetical protein